LIYLFFLFSGGREIYDDEEDFGENSPTTTISQAKLNRNGTSYIKENAKIRDYNDEASSYQDNIDDDDDDNLIYADTMSVNRPDSKNPIIEPHSTVRIPYVQSNLWRDLFSKPTILVGKLKLIFVRRRKQNNFLFRYYWWNSYWYAFGYSSRYVYYLSNA
jgi:hypothetical protein